MKILVSNPKFKKEFKENIVQASRKGCKAEITDIKDYSSVIVYSSNRPVGKFFFEKDGDILVLTKKFIIEREYRPFECAINALVKFYKKKKIKYVVWHDENDIIDLS